MSRREIRRMLLTPKTQPKKRPWLIPALMAGFLLTGIGVGVGVGQLLTPKPTSVPAGQMAERTEPLPPLPDETRPVRPPEEGLLRPVLPEMSSASAGRFEDFQPIVPLPPPRPGGPEDDGFNYDDPDHTPIADVPPLDPPPAMDPPVVTGQPAISSAPTAAGTSGAGVDLSVPPPARTNPLQAALPQPMTALPPVRSGNAAWLRHAVPGPITGNRPIIAVMIDDLGVDKKRSEKTILLRPPLTLAWMTYAEDLPRTTQSARQRGHELMVHMPMQPMADHFDAGRDVLRVDLPPEELRRRINWGLDRFNGFIGINNHMGSRFTTDRAGMRIVMEELRRRGLVFVDSVTSEKTVGAETARLMGVPSAARHVFIDNVQTVGAVTAQLQKAEEYARKHGMAIAIGHPHDATIEALAHWLPGLDNRGLVLVPVSTIIKRMNAMAD